MVSTGGGADPGGRGQDSPWLTEDELGVWLEVSAIALRLPALLEAQLQRDSDVGLYEYLVMSWLSMMSGRRARMGELAQVTEGSLSRLSNVVKRLEARGFVARSADPEDGRFTVAALTDAGWEKVVQAAPGHARAVKHYVVDPLTANEIRDVKEISAKIATRIRGVERTW
ncbi:MarR family transcriptional regulator [Nakamurella sp. YIM 132087]|uniref:MarR family transcriptional regulator n=1 Tax=Nakamurella alba TaxID=2665158 RepID=A0A7K1FRY5_9ACTN|nr:MarR family transcriptional regulator [Nakamurella alba]MTD16906.1 MarR family transcriptional regulator [Nakamurella alba]